MPDIEEYTAFAQSLADIARPIAARYFASDYAMQVKADNTPVTQADQDIEASLREEIMRHYPQHGIFGEETGQTNMASEYCWVIDPIDGTKAFIAGKKTFTTLIALCHNGVPMLGVIDQPIKQERWVAAQGSACLFGDERSTVSDCNDISDALIATTSMGYFTAAQTIGFRHLEHATRSTILNHDAYAYGMLASGDLDVVVDAAMKPYDFCALTPVVESAGGMMTDWNGEVLTMHSAGHVVAAANKTLHKAALDLLHSASH